MMDPEKIHENLSKIFTVETAEDDEGCFVCQDTILKGRGLVRATFKLFLVTASETCHRDCWPYIAAYVEYLMKRPGGTA